LNENIWTNFIWSIGIRLSIRTLRSYAQHSCSCTWYSLFCSFLKEMMHHLSNKLSPFLVIIILFLVYKSLEYFSSSVRSLLGPVICTFLTFLMIEVNTKFASYRIYEGFMCQVAFSFLFSNMTMINWKISTLTLAISYLWFWIRMLYTFDDLDIMLKNWLIITTIAYGVNSYTISRNFKDVFSAKYEAKESSKAFRNLLHNLPEGVAIKANFWYQ